MSGRNTPVHSTGRGGAGNIGEDDRTYADAGIVREGPVGESPAGEFSTGRGGAGNIGSPKQVPQGGAPGAQDVIPETALRQHQEDFHTGRGGQGNVHKEKYGGHTHGPEHENILDKAKSLIGLDGKHKKEGEEEPKK